MNYKSGDKVWYLGTHLPKGLYTYVEECPGWEHVGYIRHKISRPSKFKINKIDKDGNKTGHTYGHRVNIFEAWEEEIRPPTQAELILYGRR